MTPPASPSGLLLVDKPGGRTSHDVVRWVRRELGQRRVGHAGTLDPLATGLLPCLVGSATRLVQYLHGWPKTYVGVVALGAESPTGDIEGLEGTLPPAVPTPPAASVLAAEERLRGTYLQQPPAFSAKKIGGVRAHHLARRGYETPLSPVPVTVHRLRLVRAAGGRIHFAAEVSSGTYLRSLARDLGRLLGTGAYLAVLRRTGIGPLRVRQALRPSWESGTCAGLADRLLGLEAIPLRLPTVVLDRDGSRLFSQGRLVPGRPGTVTGPARALDAEGRLLGVAEIAEGGELAPRTVLREADPVAGSGAGSWSLAHPVDGW